MNRPIIPWMGGKSRLAKDIIPLFPPHTCYVEPFAGGAAIFFMKDPSKSEVLNDADGELVNLYRVVKFHLEEFVHQFNFALVSRQMFEWSRMTNPQVLTDVQRAARFYFLVRTCFGARMTNPSFGTGTTAPPKIRMSEVRDQLIRSWERLSMATIEHLDWQECIQRYDRRHTLFYLDPPYWQVTGYGRQFEFDQYEAMASLLGSMKGKAVMSINDQPDIQALFAAFPFKKVGIKYTLGLKKAQEKSGEPIYYNFTPDEGQLFPQQKPGAER